VPQQRLEQFAASLAGSGAIERITVERESFLLNLS
jgi:hypothetical protein